MVRILLLKVEIQTGWLSTVDIKCPGIVRSLLLLSTSLPFHDLRASELPRAGDAVEGRVTQCAGSPWQAGCGGVQHW